MGSDSSKRPHDPRLLLQVASSPCDKSTSKERDAEISYSPTYVPKSPRGSGKNRLGGGLASDIEDISDAEKEEPEEPRKEAEDDDADAIHGNLRQNKRDRVIKAFRNNHFRILVGTDVASRGLDIPSIKHVINYDLPQVPEDFIHRVGRTARGAGGSGRALLFIYEHEVGFLRYLK